jgi:translation initiation factor IF-3
MKKDNLKSQYRVNEQIRAREVRIVGDDIESQVLSTRDALHIAEQKGVDLVEISPNADPPVCRLIDYSKFIYQQKKRQKEMKAKQVKIDVKEIRFGPQTDDHDYNFKLKHAMGFLADGDKVKAYVFFRGRSILFKEQGEVLLLRFAQDLEEYGKVESMPVLEGKRMIMFIAPKKVTPKKPAVEGPLEDEDFEDEEERPIEEPVRKKPQQKAPKEYTGPKVEGENWDD